ncbi:MAG: helix-turn-helix domain-containing protein [Candidatus Woesearchaeota archaeon]
MNNKIDELLFEFGLNNKEIQVYKFLVQKKELNAYVLAKLAGIHRSTVYSVLERLISKGFIHKLEKDGTTFYSALEIGQIIAKIKDKESILLSLIPEIEKIHESKISNVRVFESKESQKQFNFNLYNQISKGMIKELYIISGGPAGFAENKSSEHLSSKLFLEKILKELKDKKLHKIIEYKGIWNEKFKGSEILKTFLEIGETRFLKELPTLATTVIFGEYVAYMFTMNGTPQVIEIQNKLIAEENKAYFSYLWKQAEK